MESSERMETLVRWADYGNNLIQRPTPSWSNIESFIEAGIGLQELRYNEACEIAKSLKIRSNQGEPFFLDLSCNPSFASVREERYSDYLKWLLEKADWNKSWPFDLLKIDANQAILQLNKGRKPRIEREVPVKEGHEGQSGRVDILILFEKALVDIEVKVTDAEHADLEKNEGYRTSLEKRYPKNKFEHYHRLLVTDALKDQYNEKPGYPCESYLVIKWNSVCISIRHLVYSGDLGDPLMESLFLVFAGSVEQCLLGYQFLNGERKYVDLRTLQYIEGIANYYKNLEGKDE